MPITNEAPTTAAVICATRRVRLGPMRLNRVSVTTTALPAAIAAIAMITG